MRNRTGANGGVDEQFWATGGAGVGQAEQDMGGYDGHDDYGGGGA